MTATLRDCIYGQAVGALAGIAYGFDAMPDSWIGFLRGKDVIDGCLF